jgi:hypothetical protein
MQVLRATLDAAMLTLSVTTLPLASHVRNGVVQLSLALRPRIYGPAGTVFLASQYAEIAALGDAFAHRKMALEVEWDDGLKAVLPVVLDDGRLRPGLWKRMFAGNTIVEVYPDSQLQGLQPIAPMRYSRAAIHEHLQLMYSAAALALHGTRMIGSTSKFQQRLLQELYSLKRASPAPRTLDQAIAWFKKWESLPERRAYELRPDDRAAFSLFFAAQEGAMGLLGVPKLASSEPIDIDSSHDNQLLEFSSLEDVHLRLPPPASLPAGFRFTAANRAPPGNLHVSAQSGQEEISVAPEDFLTHAAHSSIHLCPDAGWIFQTDGKQWIVFGENAEEFHRALGAVDAYPVLSRAVGTTFDVSSVPMETLRPGWKFGDATVAGRLRMVPLDLAGPTIVWMCPWIAVQLESLNRSSGRELVYFAPRSENRPRSERLRGGFLDLSQAIQVHVDLDMPTLKWLDRANPDATASSSSLRESGAIEVDATKVWPALREIGAEVSHASWATSFEAATRRTNLLNSQHLAEVAKLKGTRSPAITTMGSELFAEDLLLGYRIDVEDPRHSKWLSLCERKLEFRLDGPSGEGSVWYAMDEGVVSPGETSEGTTTTGSRTSRASEALFRWKGWSLVAPDAMAGGSGTSAGSLMIRREAVERSLPSLRIGSEYRYRARVADIAGNGWSREEADQLLRGGFGERYLSARSTYQRFRPVEAPRLRVVSAAPNEQRESAELAIAPGRDWHSGTATWSVYPPRVDHQFARELGLFDGMASSKQTWEFARRSASEFLVENGTGRELLGHHDIPAQLLKIVDPAVQGLAWRYLPGNEMPSSSMKDPSGSVGSLDFSVLSDSNNILQEFPSSLSPSGKPLAVGPVRVKLSAGPRSATLTGTTLHVTLPPGERQQCLVSCTLRSEALNSHGILSWANLLGGELRAHSLIEHQMRTDKVEVAAIAGGNALVSVVLPVTFTHAVARPVTVPVWQSLTVDATYGSNVVKLPGILQMHRPSTASVTVQGTWLEVLDRPGTPSWMFETREENAFTQTINQDDLMALPPPGPTSIDGKHSFPDTKHRVVDYSVIAWTRYKDYFLGRSEGEYQVQSDRIRVLIPNRRIPDPFELEYAVPLLSWDDSAPSLKGWDSKFRIAGVRIYLRRPVFVTGQDERLGILVAPGVVEGDEDELSQLAEDPTAMTKPVEEAQLDRTFFGSPANEGVVYRADVTSAGLPALRRTVSVLGYALKLDAVKGLVYADIPIAKPDRFAPFLRLACVRFQPTSVPGAHVSSTRFADFIRIQSDRATSIVLASSGLLSARHRLRASITGPAKKDPATGRPATEILLRIIAQPWARKASEPDVLRTIQLSPTWQDQSNYIATWMCEFEVIRRRHTHGPRDAPDPNDGLTFQFEESSLMQTDADESSPETSKTIRHVEYVNDVFYPHLRLAD